MLPSGPGKGQAVPLTGDTGLFWFFGNSNLELIVKVLDGRPVNGHFWVFYGGLSDVEYRITVTDTTDRASRRSTPTLRAGWRAGRTPRRSTPSRAAAPGPGLPGGTGEAAPLLRLRGGISRQCHHQGLQGDPAVAIGPDGTTMVVWGGPPVPWECSATRGTSSAGSTTGRETPGAASSGSNATSARSPARGARVAASSTGEFMVVWDRPRPPRARVYGADGQPLGGEIQVGAAAGLQGQPAIVGDPAGGFLVGWPPWTNAGTGTLRLQRFSTQGNPVGNEIVAPAARSTTWAWRPRPCRRGAF